MIHFFPTFSRDAENTPLGRELRNLGVAYRIFAGFVRFDYRQRIFILLAGYPKLAWFALCSAWRSMVLARPRPTAVVLASDVEVLVFALIRALLPWSGPTIVLQGFIYTSRNHQLINRLRWFYYSFVLARCDCVICHSQIEISRYRVLFPRCAAKFAFVTWAAHVEGYEQAIADDPHDSGFHVLAAGRSGRDYKTLAAAVAGTGIEVTVICDSLAGLGGVSEDAQFRIRRDCYGQDYLAELRRSDVVVVPLAVDNISAGQMVMIQAMAYGRPLIVTDTPTVREYLNDGVEGLLVPRADPPKLAAALMRLRNDPALRQLLGAGGRAAYLARFSQRALLQGVVDAVAQARSPRL